MTLKALIMLLATWTVVAGIAGRLFWRVLKTPRKDDG